MEALLPTVEAIQDIESRQDEVLRKLDELEKRIAQALVQFGDQRLIKTIESAPASLPPVNVEPIAKAA